MSVMSSPAQKMKNSIQMLPAFTFLATLTRVSKGSEDLSKDRLVNGTSAMTCPPFNGTTASKPKEVIPYHAERKTPPFPFATSVKVEARPSPMVVKMIGVTEQTYS